MPIRDGAPADENTLLVERAYRCHGPLLREIAERKFRVPPSDAETLVNEVFVTYLRRQSIVENAEKWLVGAVCHASRGYWRMKGRTEPLPPFVENLIDARDPDPESRIVGELFVAAGLLRLERKCRVVITFYYRFGYSAAEIATELNISTGYATQLLSSCRKHAREVFGRMLGGLG